MKYKTINVVSRQDFLCPMSASLNFIIKITLQERDLRLGTTLLLSIPNFSISDMHVISRPGFVYVY